MSEIFNAEQRRFLKLLGLAVPGESPVLPLAKNQAASAPVQAETKAEIPESTASSLKAPEGIRTLRAAAGILSAPPTVAGVPQPVAPELQPKIPAEPEAAATLSDLPAPAESAEPQRLQQISASDWRDLQIMVHNCRACSLGETRQHAVFGAGNPRGSWLFVGEAPGAEEDRRGEAFVGRGGQLLDNMLKAMGLTRQQDVYIANVLKCRPPTIVILWVQRYSPACLFCSVRLPCSSPESSLPWGALLPRVCCRSPHLSASYAGKPIVTRIFH